MIISLMYSYHNRLGVITSLIFFLFITSISTSLYAQNDNFTIEGKIFIDENKDGILNATEKGKQGVLVSNGIDVVSTDENGMYKIEVSYGQHIFPILPSGYSFKNGDSWWYSSTDKALQKVNRGRKNVNFALLTTTQKDKIKILAIGDVQVGDDAELDYAGRTIFNEIMARTDYDLNIFMGDLVNDEPDLMRPIKNMIDALDGESWTVYGNHDRNFEKTQKQQAISYNQHFGPRNYAFLKSDILFIGLNSLIPKGRFGYEGGYSDNALNFMDNILESISRPQQIVIVQHIPFRWIRNNDQLTAILKKHHNKKVLVLSAHTHTVFQNYYENNDLLIHEVNVGATSGHWWTGQKNWQGNPLALMKDGTPRGYFEISFFDDTYNLKYKGVGLDQDKQMSIWLGENYDSIRQRVDSENRDVYVNIFAGSERTKVKMRVDKGNWITLKKVEEFDPFVANIKQLQESEKYPNEMSKKSPYLDSKSKHLWKGQIPKNLDKGMYKLVIDSKTPFGQDLKESTWFWIE